MKKIAMLTDGWKRMVTYAWVDGIINRIRELDEDICIYQYNCYGNWRREKKYNLGEYNIFRLPDLNEFDGVVLDCNFTIDKERQQELASMLQKVEVPVISIGHAMDNCYYVGIDNTTPIKNLMEHLHKEHGCTRFLYAGGPKGHYENYSRMKAFKSFILENGLIEQDTWFGDYEYANGIKYMDRLVNEAVPFPDAIICANDNIAAGICARAMELGYSVPEDFIVTGFDNMEKAAYFYPQLTTINNDRGKIAAAIVDMFHELWAGRPVDSFRFVPTTCSFGESCGCPNNNTVDYRQYIKGQIIYNTQAQVEDEQRVAMEGRMAECTDYYGIFHEMSRYVINHDSDAFYAVLDKRLWEGIDEKMLATKGYPKDQLVVAYAAEGNKTRSFENVEALYAYLEKAEQGTAYMFTPLHFRQYTVGYTIVKNARFLYYDPYFYDIQSGCARSLEAMFKQIQLETINRRLEEVYNRDPMTGLYNRMAYTEMIGPAFEQYQEAKVPCCLAFFDVNYFKEINDSMGHEFGDTLLKRIAKILMDLQPENGYSYRFGGDEFVVFFPNATEEKAKEYRDGVLAEAKRSGISVSIGMVVTNPEEDNTLDDYLAQADVQMYKMKNAIKAKR
jgi:diguanylate cyclase (GGDEF)-like protein